jgi:abortive infection bacteriophage resistance protein
LYIFDRKLRLILLDAVERIEVALRTHLTHRLSEQYGPFGYADPNTFGKGLDHAAYMQEIREAEHGCSETFVAHFRKKYTNEEHLPIWMATELLSFGCISRMYAESSPGIKRSFADRLGVADRVVRSWMHSLSYIRNVCAHHSRLWNRTLAIKPLMPNKCRSWPYIVPQTERLYSVLVITRHCLQRIAPDCRWRHRLFDLIDAHPTVPLEAMQIPKDWRTHLPWTGNS